MSIKKYLYIPAKTFRDVSARCGSLVSGDLNGGNYSGVGSGDTRGNKEREGGGADSGSRRAKKRRCEESNALRSDDSDDHVGEEGGYQEPKRSGPKALRKTLRLSTGGGVKHGRYASVFSLPPQDSGSTSAMENGPKDVIQVGNQETSPNVTVAPSEYDPPKVDIATTTHSTLSVLTPRNDSGASEDQHLQEDEKGNAEDEESLLSVGSTSGENNVEGGSGRGSEKVVAKISLPDSVDDSMEFPAAPDLVNETMSQGQPSSSSVRQLRRKRRHEEMEEPDNQGGFNVELKPEPIDDECLPSLKFHQLLGFNRRLVYCPYCNDIVKKWYRFDHLTTQGRDKCNGVTSEQLKLEKENKRKLTIEWEEAPLRIYFEKYGDLARKTYQTSLGSSEKKFEEKVEPKRKLRSSTSEVSEMRDSTKGGRGKRMVKMSIPSQMESGRVPSTSEARKLRSSDSSRGVGQRKNVGEPAEENATVAVDPRVKLCEVSLKKLLYPEGTSDLQ